MMVTDVLSFPTNVGLSPNLHPEVLGDIVISLPYVFRQAKEKGIPFYEELDDILIHGILHLQGYTHGSESTARKMRKKEKEIESRISKSEILSKSK